MLIRAKGREREREEKISIEILCSLSLIPVIPGRIVDQRIPPISKGGEGGSRQPLAKFRNVILPAEIFFAASKKMIEKILQRVEVV